MKLWPHIVVPFQDQKLFYFYGFPVQPVREHGEPVTQRVSQRHPLSLKASVIMGYI